MPETENKPETAESKSEPETKFTFLDSIKIFAFIIGLAISFGIAIGLYHRIVLWFGAR